MSTYFNAAGLSLPVEPILGRKEWAPTTDHYATYINGASILITGAAGSIGKALTQDCIRLGGKVVALDSDEERLFNLKHDTIAGRCTIAPGDITDRAQIEKIVQLHSPQIVFHLAARKHVPFTESSVRFATGTNVLGTLNVLDACRDAPSVTLVVFTSSDKAIHASNVLGITKRIGELLFFGASATSNKRNMHAVARLCNVLGSSGTVVEHFVSSALRGTPMTVYSSNLSRYFISLTEAVALIKLTASLSSRCLLTTLHVGSAIMIATLAERLGETLQALGYPAKYEVIESLDHSESRHEALWYDSEKVSMVSDEPGLACIRPPAHHMIGDGDSLRAELGKCADDTTLLAMLRELAAAAS